MKFPHLNFHDRKTQLGLGGAGAVAALALYRKHAKGAANPSATGTVTDPVATAAFDASSIENGIVGDLQPQIDSLAAQLAGLKPSSPKPAPPPSKKPPPKKKPAALPPVNASQFPLVIPKNGLPNDPLVDLGIIGPGAMFTGHNVKNGAPVYALVGGQAVQNFDPKKLAPGTHLETLKRFAAYIDPRQVKEQL
jgi:hypothetical protein